MKTESQKKIESLYEEWSYLEMQREEKYKQSKQLLVDGCVKAANNTEMEAIKIGIKIGKIRAFIRELQVDPEKDYTEDDGFSGWVIPSSSIVKVSHLIELGFEQIDDRLYPHELNKVQEMLSGYYDVIDITNDNGLKKLCRGRRISKVFKLKLISGGNVEIK